MITCPSCETDDVIIVTGPKIARVLFVGSKSHKHDKNAYKPFQGAYGGILRKELARVGLDLNSFRLMYAFLHDFKHTPGKTDGCYEASLSRVLTEAKNRVLVVTSGSEAVTMMSNGKYSVLDVMGVMYSSPYTKTPIMGFPSIGSVFSAIGEMRNATEKLAKFLETTNE
jgi:uracil-DNA glycosylase